MSFDEPRRYSRIAVETELDQCIAEIGGVRVSDLVGQSPNFSAADYMFDEDEVVVELKCLEENKIDDEAITEKASLLYAEALRDGTAPVVAFGTVRLTTDGFPESFVRKLAELYRRPIQGVIKKANKQIRQTKQHLNRPRHKGLLLLVNDGHQALDPSHVMWLLHETFRRNSYSSINSVVFFTVNLLAKKPDIDRDLLVWIPANIPDRDPCPSALLKRLQESWIRRMSQKTGMHIPTIEISGSAALESIKNSGRIPP